MRIDRIECNAWADPTGRTFGRVHMVIFAKDGSAESVLMSAEMARRLASDLTVSATECLRETNQIRRKTGQRVWDSKSRRWRKPKP